MSNLRTYNNIGEYKLIGKYLKMLRRVFRKKMHQVTNATYFLFNFQVLNLYINCYQKHIIKL